MTEQDLEDYLDNLKKTYKGDLTYLAAALGALDLGKIYGWKVLRIIYSSVTYRKYQKILGFEFKAVLPETTDYSMRSAGFKLVTDTKKFWEVAKGHFSIDSEIKTLATTPT